MLSGLLCRFGNGRGTVYSSPASGLASGTLSIAASNLSLFPRAARWTKSFCWLLHAPTACAMANAARRSTDTPSMLARRCMDFKTGSGSSAVIVLTISNLAEIPEVSLFQATQAEDRHTKSIPLQFWSASQFHRKAFNAINAGQKIDQRIIGKCRNGRGQHGSSLFDDNPCESDKLAFRNLNPDVGIDCGGRNSLQNRGGHSGYLKPYSFLLECLNKPCERRKFS